MAEPDIILLARRSMSEALMLQAFGVDHLSVRTCEQSRHSSMHWDAVWVVSGVGLGSGVLDFGGDRRMGRGSLGVNKMQKSLKMVC